MNRTRQQIKAAKARKEWQLLQEKKLKEEEMSHPPKLKKVKNTKEENQLRDTA